MSSVFNKATICPYGKPNCAPNSPERLALDPDITKRFAESRDYNELEYLWLQWHEQSGKLMRNDYREYVRLMNKIGTLNGFKNASAYWQDDFEDPQFEQHVDELWNTVKPLYDDLYTYMRYKLIEIYGKLIISRR